MFVFTLIVYAIIAVVALMAVAMRLMFDGRLLNAMEAVVTSLYASGNVFLLSLLLSVIEMGATADPLSVNGLITAFIVLFPFCVRHAGRGLFDDWGMACYTAMTPILAVVLGFGVFVIGTGLSALFVQMVGGRLPVILPLSLEGGVLLLVLGPAVAPFLVDMSG